MSFLGWGESIFSKVKGVLEKIFEDEPKVEKAILISLEAALPFVETITDLTAGEAAAAAIGNVVAEVETELQNITTTVIGAGTSPTTTTALNSIVTNLNSLLTGGLIKDPKVLGKVELAVKTVVTEIEDILKVL